MKQITYNMNSKDNSEIYNPTINNSKRNSDIKYNTYSLDFKKNWMGQTEKLPRDTAILNLI